MPAAVEAKRGVATASQSRSLRRRGQRRSGRMAAWVRYSVATTPPSILMSAPVVLADRSLARKRTRSATSSGVVNRPVAAPLTADATTSSTPWPLPLAFECASPPVPSHKGVDTGQGVSIL